VYPTVRSDLRAGRQCDEQNGACVASHCRARRFDVANTKVCPPLDTIVIRFESRPVLKMYIPGTCLNVFCSSRSIKQSLFKSFPQQEGPGLTQSLVSDCRLDNRGSIPAQARGFPLLRVINLQGLSKKTSDFHLDIITKLHSRHHRIWCPCVQ
jgi:hypothetical protein